MHDSEIGGFPMKKALIAILILALAGITCTALADGLHTVQFSDSGLESAVEGVAFENGILRITEPGEYLLSGELTNGQIAVNCEKDGKVTLYLNGVRIHNETGAALLVGECAPRLVVSLMEGTENSLSNGASLVYTDGDEPNGVIFSDSDLTLNGAGSLTITAGSMDGIVSKDDLKIENGILTVNAERHGLRGKDFVQISGGTLRITAGGDGIKSTNKSDPDRGYVEITGGYITIRCGDEPIQAVTTCRIEEAVVEFQVTK